MARERPYQPSLLRVVHGLSAVLGLLAIATGFWVYNVYDGRFGRLPLPDLDGTIDLHGTVGVFFFLVFPLLALYSFHLGAHRLLQPGTLGTLAQGSRPRGRRAWHQLANTLMLLAGTAAIVSGRQMQESWLPAGELDRPWYSLHLASWLLLLVAVAVHVAVGLWAGGRPLLASMADFRLRKGDGPRQWQAQIRAAFANPRPR